METLTRRDDVVAVLSDPGYTVPSAGGGPRGTLAWLRANVCRFSEGADHDRRLGVVEAQLARMDPAALRAEARERAGAVLRAAPEHPVAAVARPVPTAVLGRALGVVDLDALVTVVPVAAAVYLTGTDEPDAADTAVTTLVELLGPGTDEVVANRIAILLQSCDATATLITRAAGVAAAAAIEAEAAIDETLRLDPPVTALRRIGPDGTPVALDVVTANKEGPGHLTFGAGRRPCPGADHAVQLAAGVIEALKENER